MEFEHPDITSALATGYPRGILDRELPRCGRCRAIFMPDEEAYLIDGKPYCRDCFPEEIVENTPTIDLVAILGVKHCPAEELAV